MSVNVGTAIGYLDLDTSKWNRGFANAKSQLSIMADSTQSAGNRFQATGQMMQSVGSSMSKFVTLPLVGVGVASLNAAIKFESAFTGVRKTVDATDAQFKVLEKGIRSMSKTMPQSAAEIASVSEAAGQLGIKREDILSFTKVMVQLGDSTNLSSEEAASSLAKFANVTGMSMDNVDRLGSTIVDLGNNLATTESDIVSMGQRMASSGSQIGMSEAQILSWAGAMSSVGIEAEVGGSSFSKFAKDVQLSVETGGSKLNQFAKIAGMSSSDFQKAFKEDASSALQTFIKGLSESEDKGTSVAAVLADLGYKQVGMSQTLSSLAGGYGTLNGALDTGSKAWKENTALAKEAETRYATTESRLSILKNKFVNLGISIGRILLPVLENLMSATEKVVDFLDGLDEKTQEVIVTIGLIVAAIGPILLMFGSLAGAIGNLMPVFKLLNKGLMSLASFILSILAPAIEALFFLMIENPIVLVIASIVALVAGFVYLWNHCDKFKQFWVNMWTSVKEWCSNAIEAIKLKFTEWGTAITNFVTVTIPRFIQGISTWFSQLPTVIGNWLTTAWTNITTWCGKTWNTFITWCTNVITSVGEWFSQLPYKIGFALGAALGTIVQWGIDAWTYLSTNVPLWIEGIGTWFAQLPGKIWQWLVSTYEKVTTWGSQMLQKAIEVGTNFINNTVTFFTQLPGQVWNFLSQSYSKAVTWGSQMVAKAVEAGSQFISRVSSFMQQLPGQVWNFLSQAISKAVSFATQFAQKGMEAARKFGTNIMNGLKGLPGQVVSIGTNIVQGLWRGISGAAGWLAGKVKSFATGIVDGMRSALGIHSPSRVMRDIVGANIVKGIGVGLDNEMPGLEKDIDRSMKGLVDNMSTDIDMSSKVKAPSMSMDWVKDLVANVNAVVSSPNTQSSNLEGVPIIINIDGREVFRAMSPHMGRSVRGM